jgi:hypothetical protein
MKVIGTLSAAVLVLAFNASGSTLLLFCGGFAVPPNATSSSITCPGISGLGPLTSFTAVTVITTDFSGGTLGQTNSSEAQYTSSVAGFTTDTLTAIGTPNSSSYSDTLLSKTSTNLATRAANGGFARPELEI